jgi:hypothetical protein
MQDDDVCEVVAAAGLHQLRQHQTTTVDVLRVGHHQTHLLQDMMQHNSHKHVQGVLHKQD